ncbi:MAG TPA: hypothetical protein VM871_09140 [Flavisolibacter sp.]|nr:hypothetical protein [Flavisolibacter sp.]
MKNKIALAAALFLYVAAGAQTTPDSSNSQKSTGLPVTTTTVSSDASHAAYIADPESLKGLTTETLRPEHAFPILGTYNASGTSAGNVTITLDSVNKGIVWVEGLSQGRFKALMKKAPSTYKIPAQKSEAGKTIAEGTLFFNPTSKELTIVLGRSFNDVDPTAALTNPKQNKGWQYTGTKANGVTTSPASPQ